MIEDRFRPRRRRRVLLTAALASVLLVPFAPVAAAATPTVGSPTCRMISLPTPEGSTTSQVNGADPTGRYMVGVASTPLRDTYTTTGLLWKNGRLTVLDTSADIVGNISGAVVVWPADRPGTVRVLTQPDGATNAAATVGSGRDVQHAGTTGAVGVTEVVAVRRPRQIALTVLPDLLPPGSVDRNVHNGPASDATARLFPPPRSATINSPVAATQATRRPSGETLVLPSVSSGRSVRATLPPRTARTWPRPPSQRW